MRYSDVKIQGIINEIDKYDVVSFDVFDTLINRLVYNPTDVFYIVQYKYELKEKKILHSYAEDRILAEIESRKESIANRGTAEICFDDIFKQHLLSESISNMQLESLKELELDTELELSYANPIGKFIYEYCVRTGKKIICVSDMYHSADFIQKLLQKCGYEVSNIYVSCEYSISKHCGRLYDCVLDQIGIAVDKIIHIGDNEHADYQQALKKGINAIHIPKISERNICYSFEELSRDKESTMEYCCRTIYFGLINKHYLELEVAQNKDIEKLWWNSYGYRRIGAIVLSFTQWIIEEASKDKIEKLWFLSRDGYLPFQTFQVIAEYFPSKIEADYLFASRRLFILPAIEKLDDDFITTLIYGKYLVESKYTVREHLQTWGINADQFKDNIIKAGFIDCDQMTKFPDDNYKLKELWISLEHELIKCAQEEKKCLIKYLTGKKFLQKNTEGIVDLGWHASMQDCLLKVAKKESHPNSSNDLYGYYFGLWYKAQEKYADSLLIRGYINNYSMDNDISKLMRLNGGVELLELFFQAPHGSIIRISDDGKTPVCAEFDINPDRMELLKDVHEGSLAFVKDFMDIKKTFNWLSISKVFTQQLMTQTITYPNIDEASKIGELEFGTCIGENFHTVQYAPKLALPTSIDDFKSLNSVVWKSAARKRISEEFKNVKKCVLIVMSTNNRPVSFRRAIESIIKQTYQYWNLVVINDGGNKSEINSIISEFSGYSFERIKIIHNEIPKGMGAAINIGIRSQASNFICIHNDSDVWQPTFLDESVNALNRLSKKTFFQQSRTLGGLVCSYTEVIEHIENNIITETEQRPYNFVKPVISPDELARGTLFPISAFVIFREAFEAIGSFREDLPVLGDWDFALRLSEKYDICAIHPNLVYQHKQVGSSIESSNETYEYLLYEALLRNEWWRRTKEDQYGIGTFMLEYAQSRKNVFGGVKTTEEEIGLSKDDSENNSNMQLNEKYSLISDFIQMIFEKKILIWGTGSTAKNLTNVLLTSNLKKHVEIIGYIDNNAENWGGTLFDKVILSNKIIATEIKFAECIVIASQFYYDIVKQIEETKCSLQVINAFYVVEELKTMSCNFNNEKCGVEDSGNNMISDVNAIIKKVSKVI